jgi:hypothetical protein
MYFFKEPKPDPLATYADYTPAGPWTDGQEVTRNYDGVLFTYSALLNTLTIIPNKSGSVKNANNFIIQNLPAPSTGGDATNKTYVDSMSGGGGGTPSDSAPLMNGVAAPGTSTLYSRGDHVHPSDTSRASVSYVDSQDALRAPLASPVFTGDPQAPTPTAGDNDTSVATTAFVTNAVTTAAVPPATVAPLMDGTAAVGTATKYAREDHRHPTDTSREPTITVGTTSQYYRGDKSWQTLDKTAVGLSNVDNTSDMSKPVSTATQTALNLKADLVSPVFTGNPTAPTPTAGDNDTSVATTAFVTGAVATATVPPATLPPVMDGTAAVGTATKYAREDHVHPSDTSRAPLASPTFTGVPAAPTASPGTNTTQIATTAFVTAATGSSISEAPNDGVGYVRKNLAWNDTIDCGTY